MKRKNDKSLISSGKAPQIEKEAKLSLRQWLDRYGSEDCGGCQYNNIVKAHCSYKGPHYCVRYDSYLRDTKNY